MRARLAIALALTAVAAAGTTLSGATFTAAKSNPGNAFAAAADFCNGGPQTLSASKDAWVNQLSGTENNGSSTTLSVQSTTALILGARRSLVDFTLPSIPAFCDVTAATLSLYATSPTSGLTIDAVRAGSSWSESTVTWNNQPATTGSAVGISSGSSAGVRSWDVTSQVQTMYSSGNAFGWVVQDHNEVGVLSATQTYQSREGTPDSQDPQLLITFG